MIDKIKVTTEVLIINFVPILRYPIIITGMFSIKKVKPVETPNTVFIIVAIPVKPPGDILFCEMKNNTPNE